MILGEKILDKIVNDMVYDETSKKVLLDLYKGLIGEVGKQYFRIGCQFVKEELGLNNCLTVDENTKSCLSEINNRVSDDSDCQKIIDFYLKRIEEEDDDSEEEFSEKESNS